MANGRHSAQPDAARNRRSSLFPQKIIKWMKCLSWKVLSRPPFHNSWHFLPFQLICMRPSIIGERPLAEAWPWAGLHVASLRNVSLTCVVSWLFEISDERSLQIYANETEMILNGEIDTKVKRRWTHLCRCGRCQQPFWTSLSAVRGPENWCNGSRFVYVRPTSLSGSSRMFRVPFKTKNLWEYFFQWLLKKFPRMTSFKSWNVAQFFRY